MTADHDEFLSGERLGGFRIVRRIGRGGMGSVYLAEDERLGRLVALKVILSELAHDEGFRRRFEAEARGAAAIDHPNVVRSSRPVPTRGTSTWRCAIPTGRT